jgi:imidazole glycerol-phosphate synthase subunit HisH
MRTVSIVDYGIGNLLSVSRAVKNVGCKPRIVTSSDEILNSEILILPGVGAFFHGMEGLDQQGLIDPIKEYAQSGRPFLGICLGMQMMMESSREFGSHTGLGLIPGTTEAIPTLTRDGHPHKVPHIGWNGLHPAQGADWEGSILSDTKDGSAVYFVHSFAVQPAVPSHRLADVDYNGQKISAAIKFGNLYGCQFHPEKSASVGLNILRGFVSLPA